MAGVNQNAEKIARHQIDARNAEAVWQAHDNLEAKLASLQQVLAGLGKVP